MKDRATLRSGIKHAIDDDAVVVQMGVEQRTKAVDEDHRTKAGRGTGIRAANFVAQGSSGFCHTIC